MKKENTYFAIAPVDGRYKKEVEDLSYVFSEYGLMKARFEIEVRYFLALEDLGIMPNKIGQNEKSKILAFINNFSEEDFFRIKEIESTTNHDVKAVEYFLREKIKKTSAKKLESYVHLGRTSEDINNLALALMLREGINILLLKYKEVETGLSSFAKENKKIPMLALTHGQPASPTTFGWEMNVFTERIRYGIKALESFKIKVKLNGATGGDNALLSAYPKINWRKFSQNFISSLNDKNKTKFVNNPFTTQIEPHDTYRELFDIIRGLNLVLIDFNRDIWNYISRGIIVQVPKKGEVGSSAMPQKVNPIFFENAEGNLGLANALAVFFGDKLTISRMQRDLSDSTVERNFGLAFGHTKIALNNILKGLSRIHADKNKMTQELNLHWEVVAEAYQVIMRSVGIEDGYELLKDFSRGKVLNQEAMHLFVDELAKKQKIDRAVLESLKKITPENFLGDRSF